MDGCILPNLVPVEGTISVVEVASYSSVGWFRSYESECSDIINNRKWEILQDWMML